MILPILLVALLVPTEQASMNCADTGAPAANAQTQRARGPGGTVALLTSSAAEDHGTPLQRSVPAAVHAGWGKCAGSCRPSYFRCGMRPQPVAPSGWLLTNFDTTAQQARVTDLTKQLTRTDRCGTTLGVIGTSENHVVVPELNSASGCVPQRRFLLNPMSHTLENLSQTMTLPSLYKFESSAGSK